MASPQQLPGVSVAADAQVAPAAEVTTDSTMAPEVVAVADSIVISDAATQPENDLGGEVGSVPPEELGEQAPPGEVPAGTHGEPIITSREFVFPPQPPAPAVEEMSTPEKAKKFPLAVVIGVPGIAVGVLGALWMVKSLLGGKKKTSREALGKASIKSKAGKVTKKVKKKSAAAEQQDEVEVPAEPVEVIEPDTLTVMAAECQVEAPPAPAGAAPPSLAGQVFVVSENIDVAGSATSVGVPAWAQDHPAAAATAPAVKKVVAAGATCLGKSSVQPAMLNLVGENFGNPMNKSRITGGGCTGAAVAVASGMADFALATDTLGESRIPACCCNLYSYRPTPLMVGTPSAAVAAASATIGGAPFEGLSVIAKSTFTLVKVAEAMGVTGSTRLSGEIIKFVVAQDLFDLCAPELQPATVALKKAILKWAGTDQAGAVQLVRFLSTNTDEWITLAKSKSMADVEVPLDKFLESALHGLLALRDSELHRQHGALEEVHGGIHLNLDVSESDACVKASLTCGAVLPFAPKAGDTAAALKMARQIHDVLKQTVKPDTIMVLPTMPFPPSRRTASAVEKDVFVKLCQIFNLVATMGACPCVTVPIGTLRDGSPVSVSLFAVHKFDMRLLGVAQRLVPMLQESFQTVKDEITQMAIKQQLEAQEAMSAAAEPNAAKGKESKGAADKSAPAKPVVKAAEPAAPAVDPKKLEKAEKLKAKGNEFYKAGKYADAITEYTKAINLHPNTHVYYNNRAMACIKLFRFEQAEEDCNRALKFGLEDKDKVKALLRRATARDALQKYEDAERDLRQVLNFEPNNKQAREDLNMLRQHKQEMQAAQKSAMNQHLRAQQAAGGGMPNGAAGMGGMPGMPGMPPMGGDAASNAQLQMLQQMMQQHQMNGGEGMPPMPPGFDPSQFDPGMDYDPEGEYEDGEYDAGY